MLQHEIDDVLAGEQTPDAETGLDGIGFALRKAS